MNLSRFRRALPWRIALLFALLPCTLLLFLGAWFIWGLQPLERYYLRAYWECSEGAKQPGSTTQIEWLYKVAPGRKSQPIIDVDVTSDRPWSLSEELSSSAREQGWIELAKSRPQEVASTELEGLLQEDFYDSRSFRQVMAAPLLYTSSVPLLVLCVAFMMKRELGIEWNRLREEVSKAELVVDLSETWSHFTGRIRPWIGRRIAVGKARLPRGYSAVGTAPHSAIIPDTVRQAETSPLTGEKHYLSSPSNEPPQGHSIFPGAASVHHAKEQSKPWDESQWID